MALISFDKDTVIDYIPTYGGNRDSDNPCIVRMKYIPYSRVQHYGKLLAAKAKNVNDASKVAEAGQEIQRKQFTDSVESISGYSINAREVTTAEELYDTADTDLILELIRAMESQQRLSEGQRKN